MANSCKLHRLELICVRHLKFGLGSGSIKTGSLHLKAEPVMMGHHRAFVDHSLNCRWNFEFFLKSAWNIDWMPRIKKRWISLLLKTTPGKKQQSFFRFNSLIVFVFFCFWTFVLFLFLFYDRGTIRWVKTWWLWPLAWNETFGFKSFITLPFLVAAKHNG